MKINFLLTGEGTSDLRLQSHLENIFINAGFSEAHGETPDLGAFQPKVGRTVKEKLSALVKYYPDIDVIFVHRDSDNAGADARFEEIWDGANGVIAREKIVPIVPVRMLETWLLADEHAIRQVAGTSNPKLKLALLPSTKALERAADSKDLLLQVLCEASEAQGGRLAQFKKRFNGMRARLATDLDPEGPVLKLPSYQAFRAHLKIFIDEKLSQDD